MIFAYVASSTEAHQVSSCKCLNDFKLFTSKYNKIYATTAQYYEHCNNFCKNKYELESHNANPLSTYKVAIREFHDLPKDKISSIFSKGYGPGQRNRKHDPPTLESDFKPVDVHRKERNWVEQSVQTPIHNQGSCGDCWAESALAVMEFTYTMQHNGSLTQLSLVEAAECPLQERAAGCQGGWPVDVLNYIKSKGTVCTRDEYPDGDIAKGIDSMCNSTLVNSCNSTINLTKIVPIQQDNETQLFAAAHMGVVSVAIDASGLGFSSYSYGIYDGTFNNRTDCSQTMLDHAVVVVGFSQSMQSGNPFYIVRNSWGTDWGDMDGYIYMARGVNTCGISHDAVFVIP